MKTILLILLIPFLANADTINLFTLYRTNYYTEKTYQYTLDYDKESCRITNKTPINVFFISTSSGERLKGFSSQNREYFSAQNISSPNAEELSFSFKAIKNLESIIKKRLSLKVSLNKTNGKCNVQTDFLVNGSNHISNLKKINVEYHLKNTPPFGLQPADINWLKLLGQKQSCLVGQCK